MLLQQKEVQNLFNAGGLEQAAIFDDTDTLYPGSTQGTRTYTIAFETMSGELAILCTQRNKLIVKQFKNLESAYQLILKIGFKTTQIIITEQDSDPEPEPDIAPPSAYNRVLA